MKQKTALGKWKIPFIITINGHDYCAIKVKHSLCGLKHEVTCYHDCEKGVLHFTIYGPSWWIVRIVDPETIDYPGINVYGVPRHPKDH